MKGETILCISPSVWNSIWRDPQQVMSRLARDNHVLLFEPGRNPDASAASELARNWSNLLELRPNEVYPNVTAIPGPPQFPLMRQVLPRRFLKLTAPLLNWLNSELLVRHVRRAVRFFGVEQPILWLHGLRHPMLVERLSSKLTCYFVYDETPAFTHNARIRELLRDYDDRLTQAVDVVFATSRAQWERREPLNSACYFVPNGVDFEMFHRAMEPTLPIPEDIASIPGPIIGYAGWLGYQLDVELLCKVAERYADCSLVLVGPDDLPPSAARAALREQPNVFFLGRKERHELAGYLKAFDVALMPYEMSGHVPYIYPLKLHEYLAAGRTIVTVALREVQPFQRVLRIARTHDEFLAHVGDALRGDTPQLVQARVAVARQNSWEERVAEIHRVLDQHLTMPLLEKVRS